MLRPDKDRLRLDACANGWLLVYETWSEDKQVWCGIKGEVYQDPEILLSVLREQIVPVMPEERRA